MTRDGPVLQHSQVYDIDPHNGFLPAEEPLCRLDGEHNTYWEKMLDEAVQQPLRFAGGFNTSQEERQNARAWRWKIRNMPVLELDWNQLQDVRYVRRCRVVLSYLAHFYIHSQPNPISPDLADSHPDNVYGESSSYSLDVILETEERRGKYKTTIPASLSIPWCIVSELLQLPPILTYADTVLWNWKLTDQSKGIRADNLSMTTTFSNTETERHFYKTSLMIELQGAESLRLIQSTLTALHDHKQMSLNLHSLSKIISEMIKIFVDITSACVPSVFYWDVRTWFNGSDTSPTIYDESGGLAQEAGKGWTYEGVAPDDDCLKLLTGPSAGQSSVIHALDIFLGVDHKPHHSKSAASTPINTPTQSISFMQRMQKFMPGPHARYLNHLDTYLHSTQARVPSLQQHNKDSLESNPHLIQSLAFLFPQDCLLSYNEAISMLCSLRDQHMRIVALYILGPARQPPPHHHAPLGANVRVKDDNKGKGERGTGGTELVSFLKGTRDRTRQARLTPVLVVE